MLYRYASATILVAVALGPVQATLPTSPKSAQTPQTGSSVADLRCAPGDRWGATPAPRLRNGLNPVPAAGTFETAALDTTKLPALSLNRLTHGEPVRIGVWGDSHVAGGIITHQLTQVLQTLGVESQTSFIPPLLGHRGVARLPLRKFCISRDWVIETAYTAKTPTAAGLGLASERSSARNAHVWLDLRDSSRVPVVGSLRIQYAPTDRPTLIEIAVDEGPARNLRLAPAGAGAAEGSASLSIEGRAEPGSLMRTPISTLKLKVLDGTMRLQGFALTYTRPAQVTLDVMGIPSATARGWTAVDAATLRKTVDGPAYDAVVLEYGTNEGNAPKFDLTTYRTELAESLTAMRRAFPSASCLLIGPGDRGVGPGPAYIKRGRKWVKRPARRGDPLKFANIHAGINEVQAEVGAQFGCEAWNWQTAMGGPGTAAKWVSATPPLMGGDLTHLTANGYRATADALASALGWTRPSMAQSSGSKQVKPQ